MAPDHMREPVATYADAKRWLFTYSQIEEWLFDTNADLPPEARIICDMFWISGAKLVHDLRREWNRALAPAAPARRFKRAGWR